MTALRAVPTPLLLFAFRPTLSRMMPSDPLLRPSVSDKRSVLCAPPPFRNKLRRVMEDFFFMYSKGYALKPPRFAPPGYMKLELRLVMPWILRLSRRIHGWLRAT